jgi:hypothetical protein
MRRRDYPSDLSDEEWAVLEPLIPPAKLGGRPRTTDMREVINAIFYVDAQVASGEPYRMSFHLGQRFGATSVDGVTTGLGSAYTPHCVSRSVSKSDESRPPAQQSLTVSPSRPAKKGGSRL